jgi:hypothetical protein
MPLGVAVVLCCLGVAQAQSPQRDARSVEAPGILQTLRDEAERLRPWVSSELAGSFLGAVGRLPSPRARTILLDPETRRYYSKPEVSRMGGKQRAKLEKKVLEPAAYYTTKYGSPLAYSRVVDLLGKAGMSSFSGKRIMDFGYGSIGHLKLMAFQGGDVVGVDVDSYLTALYSADGDQGAQKNAEGPDGNLRLVEGHWPGDDGVRKTVGKGYDLFLSKNTLKRGYIHPEREADPARLVHLEVDDEVFVRSVYDLLNPGGLAAIYNLSPAQNPPDKPYIPWADGRCPFPRKLLEQAGFEVLSYDKDDTAAAREMARLLGWGELGMDLETGLFGHITLLRRPEAKD